ncbi:hypothetical protein [Candidatus Enterococcus leclercqii]|uniref:hypothetical protein n=1 Tax=Candidatus Enterococcus leclercqii TaxID=1857218 RepID=UPI0013796E30|nr:hypothetical protein [Enterococcus sp. CU9D]KAF1294208.1 hypothetical protein BAU14_07415 [Enterococcus sp. CU9D]
MKKKFIVSIICLLGLSISLGTTRNVSAVELNSDSYTPEDILTAQQEIQATLNKYSSEKGNVVIFDSLKFDVDQTKIVTKEELENEKQTVINSLKEQVDSTTVEVSKEEKSSGRIQTRDIAKDGSTYVAKVNCAIPAIGWGHINQDFSAKISSSKVNQLSLLGGSYKSGITLSAWTGIRSWTTISKNKKYIQVNMKGTLSYIFKGSNIDAVQTYLATGKTSGNSLVSAVYNEWPG